MIEAILGFAVIAGLGLMFIELVGMLALLFFGLIIFMGPFLWMKILFGVGVVVYLLTKGIK
jgi:hypothetical protein